MNKQDYIAMGRDCLEKEDTPEGFAAPYPRTSASWQARAFWEGYETAAVAAREKSESLRAAADLENEAHARSLETVGRSHSGYCASRHPFGECTCGKADEEAAREGIQAAAEEAMMENYARSEYMPESVVEHISALLGEIAEGRCDDKRAARLTRKVEALDRKYAARFLQNAH